jgi:hypothetical protein
MLGLLIGGNLVANILRRNNAKILSTRERLHSLRFNAPVGASSRDAFEVFHSPAGPLNYDSIH